MICYFIVSMNTVKSLAKRDRYQTTNLFFQHYEPGVPGEGRAKWTLDIKGAKVFKTEQEAWDFATDVWGLGFTRDVFGVLAVHVDEKKEG